MTHPQFGDVKASSPATASAPAPVSAPAWITPHSNPDDDHGARTVARMAKRKELVRVRRGLYLSAAGWNGLKEWEQFTAKIHAVNATARRPPVFCGRSGADVWRLPLIDTPSEVETLVRRTSGGGRSKNGVRRRFGDPDATVVVSVDGLLVTSLAETLRDVAAYLPFAHALPSFDAAFSRAAKSHWRTYGIESPDQLREQLTDCLGTLSGAKRRRVLKVLEAADGRSGSPGESLSRAVMIQSGIRCPELQSRHADSDGLIGYSDFYWREHGLVGEFDGWAKYSRGDYLKGQLPEEALKAEKIREDRIRATGLRMVRWMWPVARNPELLRRRLHEAGL